MLRSTADCVLEGGSATWLVDDDGAHWQLDSDDAGKDADGHPLPAGIGGGGWSGSSCRTCRAG